MTDIQITRIEADTAACQHSQDDGSTVYYGLRVYVTIKGTPRILFLRTSEAMYPGNDAMIQVLNTLIGRI